MSAIESSILQLKMASNFQTTRKIENETEKKVLQLEETLATSFEQNDSKQINFIQFVPDSLNFAETQGTNFYRVKIENQYDDGARYCIKTVYGVRRLKVSQSSLIITRHTKPPFTHDTLGFYQASESNLQKKFEWFPPHQGKLSEPLYIGPPDYLFELNKTLQGELYAEFKKRYAHRQLIIYVMDSEGHLLGLNERGKIVFDIALILNIIEQRPKWQQELINAQDVFVKNQWRTILFGFIPSYPLQLFAIDATDPLFLKHQQEKNVLWKIELPANIQVQKPFAVQLVGGKWAVVLPYVLNQHTYLLFLDIQNAKILKELILPCSEPSGIVAIDSKNNSFCDAIYIADGARLWKIDINSSSMSDWNFSSIALPYGKIKGKPVVGRHPEGKGVMVYLLTENPNSMQSRIYALAINELHAGLPKFTINSVYMMGQPLLRQGYLIVNTNDAHEINRVMLYDAFTGTWEREEKLTALENLFISDLKKQYPPFIFIKKSREKENIIVANTPTGLAFCKMEVDYSRLGRRTWEARHY